MSQLYPCRFCGEMPIFNSAESTYGGYPGTFVQCIRCQHKTTSEGAWQERNARYNPFTGFDPCETKKNSHMKWASLRNGFDLGDFKVGYSYLFWRRPGPMVIAYCYKYGELIDGDDNTVNPESYLFYSLITNPEDT